MLSEQINYKAVEALAPDGVGPIKVTDMWHLPSFYISTPVTLGNYATMVSRSQIWHNRHVCLWGTRSGRAWGKIRIWWTLAEGRREGSTGYPYREPKAKSLSGGHLLSQSPGHFIAPWAGCFEWVSLLPTIIQHRYRALFNPFWNELIFTLPRNMVAFLQPIEMPLKESFPGYAEGSTIVCQAVSSHVRISCPHQRAGRWQRALQLFS